MEERLPTKGVGFVGLLQIVFIVLQFCDKIKWSWFWVLSPIWIGVVSFLLIVTIFIIMLVMQAKKDKNKGSKNDG